jgi:hypothetical protein
MAFLQVAINMCQQVYSPLHCSKQEAEVMGELGGEAAGAAPKAPIKCEWKEVDPISLTFSEV